ncbi:MAG: pyridoxamine 5'-phosphate oxidase family protein [Acidobacteria bacterium]|nr:pyridoxamine 5'-phosphate oxidase family protein [Acidobacteriota bacterium]
MDSAAKLREVYPPPAARTGQRVLDHLDARCREFIARSPFYVISTAGADGRADASPRGDPPGSLAYVLDDSTLLLPDRLGNRRVDTLTNLVESPFAGLMFFVPGLTDTLRVNGRVEISTDPELLKLTALDGKLPVSVLKVTVEEAFLHCAKALVRARLWEADPPGRRT